MGPLTRRFGERKVLIAGLVAGATGFATYGLARTGLVFMCAVPVVALWGLASPAAQALMSRRIGPSEQGALQGAIGSIMGVATMIGPALFATTFAYFIRDGARLHVPGAAYLLAASMLAGGALLADLVTKSGENSANGPLGST